MAKHKDEFYVNTTRQMLLAAKEIGAKPFLLFQYYLTWQSSPNGIKPSLQRIAGDLGLEKNAVCNLRAKLVKSGWISFQNEEVFITKSFTKNESESENHSQKMNEPFTKNERSFTKNEQTFIKNESHIRNRINKDYKEVEEARNAPAAANAEETENLSQETQSSLTTSSVQKQNLPGRRLSADDAAAMLDRVPDLPQESEAETIYRDFFGAVYLKAWQIKLMTDAVKDFRLWRRICDLWFTNGHNATNLDGLLDRYNNELARQPKYDEKGFLIHSTKPLAKWNH